MFDEHFLEDLVWDLMSVIMFPIQLVAGIIFAVMIELGILDMGEY